MHGDYRIFKSVFEWYVFEYSLLRTHVTGIGAYNTVFFFRYSNTGIYTKTPGFQY